MKRQLDHEEVLSSTTTGTQTEDTHLVSSASEVDLITMLRWEQISWGYCMKYRKHVFSSDYLKFLYNPDPERKLFHQGSCAKEGLIVNHAQGYGVCDGNLFETNH